VDPALQEGHNKCLSQIRNDEFVMLTGARASGKTTRLYWLMSQMGVDYLCFLYVTLNYEHVNSMLIFSFEFSACNKCIFSARDNVRNQVLRIFREIRNNRTTYAICSIVMCGTPNIIALKPALRYSMLRTMCKTHTADEATLS
jgi:hypothetical protein